MFSVGVDPSGQASGGGMGLPNTGNMGMGPVNTGLGMGSGNSQFPGNMNMNMMGGAQPPSGGFNHMMPGGSGGHPGQVRNSELFVCCCLSMFGESVRVKPMCMCLFVCVL